LHMVRGEGQQLRQADLVVIKRVVQEFMQIHHRFS
jgi:hypothetical protein